MEGVEVATLQGDEEKEEGPALNLDPFCRGENGDARRQDPEEEPVPTASVRGLPLARTPAYGRAGHEGEFSRRWMRYQKKAQEKEHKMGLAFQKSYEQFLRESSFRKVTRVWKNCWTYFTLKLIPS